MVDLIWFSIKVPNVLFFKFKFSPKNHTEPQAWPQFQVFWERRTESKNPLVLLISKASKQCQVSWQRTAGFVGWLFKLKNCTTLVLTPHPYFHHSLLIFCSVFFFGFQLSWILFSSAFISCKVELPWSLLWWFAMKLACNILKTQNPIENTVWFQPIYVSRNLGVCKSYNICYIWQSSTLQAKVPVD